MLRGYSLFTGRPASDCTTLVVDGRKIDDGFRQRSLLNDVTDGDDFVDGPVIQNLTGVGSTAMKSDLAGVGAGKLTGKGSGSKKEG